MAMILFALFVAAAVLFLLHAYFSGPARPGMPRWSLWAAAVAAGCAIDAAPAAFGWGAA